MWRNGGKHGRGRWFVGWRRQQRRRRVVLGIVLAVLVLAFVRMSEKPRQMLHEHRAQCIAELIRWVRIPSIAGLVEHELQVRRSARWTARSIR